MTKGNFRPEPQWSRRGELRQGNGDRALANAPSRYFNPRFQKQAVKLAPCQLYITDQLDEMLETVLGSCVAACIRDPLAGVAEINHFMLPSTDDPRSGDLSSMLRYGNHSMDMLIEGLLHRGGREERLEVKVFGGANVMSGPMVGEANADWGSALSPYAQFAGRGSPFGGRFAEGASLFSRHRRRLDASDRVAGRLAGGNPPRAGVPTQTLGGQASGLEHQLIELW